MPIDDGLSRRTLLQVGAVAVGIGIGARASTDREPHTTAGGGGNATETQTPVPGGEHLAGGSTDAYSWDIGTTLGAVPDRTVKPQIITVTGSNVEKGVHVDLGSESVPVYLRLGGFELAIGDSLSSIPDRQTDLQYIAIRTGSGKGTYANVSGRPVEALDDAIEIAVAAALADITEPASHPDINQITASGPAKGEYANTEA